MLQISILLLQQLLFSLKLFLQIVNLLLALVLYSLQVLAQPVSLLHEPLKFLLQTALLSDQTLRANLQLLVDVLVFLLQFVDVLLVLLALVVHRLVDLLELFLVLGFELGQDGLVVMLVLHFSVFAVTLELVDGLLEQCLLILIILLVLLLLFLQKFKLASPECLILLKLSLNVRVHSFDLEVFDLPLLDLFSDSELALGKRLIELLILFHELLVVQLKVLDQLPLLLFEVLMLLQLDCVFSLVLRLDLLDLLLKVFERFSLLLVLLLNVLLFLLDSGDALLQNLGGVFFLTLETLLISFDGLLHLTVVVINSLLLECDFLILESLFSLEIDLTLSQVIH